MICTNCHETNSNLARYCKKCGAVLLTPAELKRKEQNQAMSRELQKKREAEEAAKKKAAEEVNTPIQQAIRKANAVSKTTQKFEYDVVTVPNLDNGAADIKSIKKVITEKAQSGWRLVNAYSNELGHLTQSRNGTGTNSTLCEDILYFERPF